MVTVEGVLLRFSKYQDLGNDFILVDARTEGGAFVRAEQAQKLCDRSIGIGADGVLTLLHSDQVEVRMHIYNADGSVPQMCGNGLRCVVQYLLQDKESIQVQTDAGVLSGRRISPEIVEVSMGAVDLRPELVAVESRHAELGTEVHTGNPHLVLLGDTADLSELARREGPELGKHSHFPAGVNVGFARPDDHRLALVVFERGAGLTQACGTGALAAASAATAKGYFEGLEKVPVDLPGGRIWVRPPQKSGAEGFIAAPATHVFDGVVAVPDDELHES